MSGQKDRPSTILVRVAWGLILLMSIGAGAWAAESTTPVPDSPAEAAARLNALEARIAAAFDKVCPAVVRIAWSHKAEPQDLGEENNAPFDKPAVKKRKGGRDDLRQESLSGVIVSPEGHLVTVGRHVMAAEQTVVVHLPDGRRASAKPLGWCGTWDIGMLQLDGPGPWPYAQMRGLTGRRAGDVCLALGYPKLPKDGDTDRFDPAPVLRVACACAVAAPRWLATTLNMDWCDRGGGLFDLEGHLIGIHSTQWRGDTVHAGLEIVQKHWDDLAAGREVLLPLGGPGKPVVRKPRTLPEKAPPAKPPDAKEPPEDAPADRVFPSSDRGAPPAMVKAKAPTIWFKPGCSGVIVAPDGLIATCAHHELLPGQAITVCLPDGRTARGKVLGSDPICDVGMLQILDKDDWPYAELGDSYSLKPGDPCIHLGYPGGSRVRRGRPWGRVSRVIEPAPEHKIFDPAKALYTPGPLFPGDSGGGVFDLEGRLIAIHQGGIADKVNFSGRIEALREQWTSLAAGEPKEYLSFIGLGEIARAMRRIAVARAPYVVEIMGPEARLALGTVVHRDGWILTKASALEDTFSCRTSEGQILPAKLHKVSREHDLALIKADATGLPEPPWSTREPVDPGCLAAAVGLRDSPLPGVIGRSVHEVPPEPGLLPLDDLRDGQGGVELTSDWIARKLRLPLATGDVIVHIDGHPTPDQKSVEELLKKPGKRGQSPFVPSTPRAVPAKGDCPPFPGAMIAGDPIRVGVRREGKLRELRLRLPSAQGPVALRRSAYAQVLGADIPLPANACGGPVVDSSGRVIGVAIATLWQHRLYVVPASMARKVAEELRR